MRRAAIIALFASCLPGDALGEKLTTAPEGQCLLRASFTPSDDAESLSIDIMRAQAVGQRSLQGRVYVALDDMMREGAISSSVITLRVDGSCQGALPTVRERLSALALELSDTIAGNQLNEVNENWAEVSEHEFYRDMRTPIPIPR